MNKQIVRILSLSLLLSIPCGSQLIANSVAEEEDLQYWCSLYEERPLSRFSEEDIENITNSSEFLLGIIAKRAAADKEKAEKTKGLRPSAKMIAGSAVYARRNNYLFKGGEQVKFAMPEGTYNAALGTIQRIKQEAVHIYAAINRIDVFTAQESKSESRVQALAETMAKNTSYIKRLSTLLDQAKDACVVLPEEYQKRSNEIFARETSRAKEHRELVKSIAEKEVEELQKQAAKQQKDIQDMLSSVVIRNLSELEKTNK